MDKFTTNFNEVNFETKEGNNLTDINEYLKKIQKENITISDKMNVGDIVKLKGIDYLVCITNVEYELQIGIVDYAGIKADNSSKNLILFNQKDIEKIYFKKEKNIK